MDGGSVWPQHQLKEISDVLEEFDDWFSDMLTDDMRLVEGKLDLKLPPK